MNVAGPNPSSIALGRVSDDEPARNVDRIDQDDTKIGTVLQVAGALEPILAETVAKNPSRIARLGFSTAHLLAGIAVEDEGSKIEGDDLLGHDVNLTVRLLDHWSPGDIIVSEAAGDLAAKRLRKISFTKPKRIKIKGLTSRVTVMSVVPR